MPATVRQIWTPEWCSVVRTFADVLTDKGHLVRIRFLYDRATETLIKVKQSEGKTYKDLGLTRGQVTRLLYQVEKYCKRRVARTEKKREEKEELIELRAKLRQQAPSPKERSVPKKQMSLL